MTQTFGNQFLKVSGNYPAMDFRAPGWIHPPKAWWKNLTLYVLDHFEEDLKRLRLYEAVRATCYGIQMSVVNFYAIFELYYAPQGLSSLLWANWAWLCMRCGRSSEIRSRISSEASPNVVSTEIIMASRITRKAYVNVSRETREVNVVDGQPSPACPLPHLQVTRGSQQPVRYNWNAEHRQRRRVRQLQT